MSVLDFRTYLYKVFDQQGGVTIDEDGDPVVYDESCIESDLYPCDIVESGATNTIKTQDGELVSYSYTVHGERISPVLHNGQRIQIFDKSKKLVFDGSIKGFSNKQLQTIIWV